MRNTAFLLYYIDINAFKEINDTYGHSFGDLALTKVSQKFLKHVDSSYVFARIGGDEFVLLHVLSDMSDFSLEAFWKAIFTDFELPIYASGGDAVQLSFSKGVEKFSSDGTTADALMAHADSKMYVDKPKHRHTDF